MFFFVFLVSICHALPTADQRKQRPLQLRTSIGPGQTKNVVAETLLRKQTFTCSAARETCAKASFSSWKQQNVFELTKIHRCFPDANLAETISRTDKECATWFPSLPRPLVYENLTFWFTDQTAILSESKTTNICTLIFALLST